MRILRQLLISLLYIAASTSLAEMRCTRYTVVHHNRMKNLHVTSVRRYPEPPTLPLPTNVSEIFANETGRFTPERARDIAAPVLLYGSSDCRSFFAKEMTKPTQRASVMQNCSDTHVDSYDCFGAVSLNGTMQTNVPKPFCSNGKSTHLNMPGGQWARDGKYIAEDMQKSHYRSVRLPPLKLSKSGLTSHVATNTLFQTMYVPKYMCTMEYSSNVSPPLNGVDSEKEKQEMVKMLIQSKKQRFKKIIKDYGSTVIVFHTGISLISLGACYAAVISGLDLQPFIKSMLDVSNEHLKSIIDTSSTFLIAYSIHKLLAPIRLAITLTVTPILVRYLRKVGIIKVPTRKIIVTKQMVK
ncbi:unnamed protein product [Xylocopa violacea]|uniref:DUF1279 domain-containing protein n=1 Tax=Xylocopa violacea TaxID=135666 RepID=A0ABP1P122_XYLVO